MDKKEKILKKVEKIYKLSESILADLEEYIPKKKRSEKQKNIKSRKWKKRGIMDKLTKLLNTGFFDQPKTINDLKEKLHRLGIIVKNTDLSAPLLKLTKKEVLNRDKKTIGKKEIWIYKKK